MKKIFIAFIITISSCSSYTPKYIEGNICNTYKIPLKGILVIDPDNKSIFSYTDNNGYFKINRMINGRYLRVFYNGKKIDSIYIVRTHPEKGFSYNFVNGKKDTAFIDMKQKQIIQQ